jgi:kynurenine formamidase
LAQRGASGLGIDTHGIDAGTDGDLSVSHMALRQGALVLECLNNLHQVPPTGATVVVGRLPLVGGSGSPASVLALVP